MFMHFHPYNVKYIYILSILITVAVTKYIWVKSMLEQKSLKKKKKREKKRKKVERERERKILTEVKLKLKSTVFSFDSSKIRFNLNS